MSLVGIRTNLMEVTGQLSGLRLHLSEPGPFQLQFDGKTGSDLTFNYNFRSYPELLAGDAKPGQTATLYLSRPGMAEYAVRVRAVEAVLLPVVQELQTTVGKEWSFTYSLAGYDGGRTLPLPFWNWRFDRKPRIVSSVEPAGICDVDLGAGLSNWTWQLSIPFRCHREGVVTIRLRAPELAAVQPEFSIRLIVRPEDVFLPDLPRRLLTGGGVQTVYRFVPPLARPELGLRKATSLDPELLRLSLVPRRAGQESVTVGTWEPIYLQGYAKEGVARLEFELTDGTKHLVPVYLMAATIALRSEFGSGRPRREVTAALSQREFMAQAIPMLVEPETGRVLVEEQVTIRGGADPFFAAAATSNEAVARPLGPEALFEDGANRSPVGFQVTGRGQAMLTVRQPPGFVTSPDSELIVRVVEQRLTLGESPLLAADLQRQAYVRNVTGKPTEVTVTALDPELLLARRIPMNPDNRECPSGTDSSICRRNPAPRPEHQRESVWKRLITRRRN